MEFDDLSDQGHATTQLHRAAIVGDPDRVRVLIGGGANINLQD